MKNTIISWGYTLVAAYLRYTLGMIFWLAGQSKVEGFKISEGTFFLFADEYKLPLIPSDIAAVMATVSEHVFAVLLFIGFATRFGALGILGITFVIQVFVYPEEYMLHGTWAAMAIILVLFGAGKFSIDHFIHLKTGKTLVQEVRRLISK